MVLSLHPTNRLSPKAHAKGRLLNGTFTPTLLASTLSIAPHFTLPSTPLLARFSSSTGLPQIPDTDPNANPRGFAVRFLLPTPPSSSVDGKSQERGKEHETGTEQHHSRHTDIITHSTPFFPTRTGEDFLALLRALGDGSIGDFLQQNPSAKRFVEAPKPSPVSFVSQEFWGVNAFILVDAEGKRTAVRYRIVPVADGGVKTLGEEELKAKSETYLFDELEGRFADPNSSSPKVSFKLLAQIAEAGDPTDDATVLWPEGRRVVELGLIELESLVDKEESDGLQKRVIFDPIPRVKGVEASKDPLLEMRAGVYLVSGRGRRKA
jgi:catalase